MTIPADPVKVARALARHVRNSHAIGKLVIDTALKNVTRKRGGASPTVREASPNSAAGSPVTRDDEPNQLAKLPLPPGEWALLSSGDVVDMIDGCDAEAVRAIGAYEETHRRRRLVIQAVRNRLAQ